MDVNYVFKLIEERKKELFELLGSFIRIDSQSFGEYGNEQALAEYIHTLCLEIGLESEMYSPLDVDGLEHHSEYIPGRNLKNRYNVTACWKGVEDKNELMLMAHTDTVEIGDVSKWEIDPFSGEVKDGKIYGRGACDDKYALAMVLFIIKLLKEAGFKPKANLFFSAYSDEEYGGSHGALASVIKYPCNRIVNIDGDEGQIWHCGAGGQEVKYTYHTKELTSSAETAARAIQIVLDVMKGFADNRRTELEENKFFSGTEIPETSLRYMGVRAGSNGIDLGTGEVHFVYYTDKTKEEIYAEFDGLEKELKSRLKQFGIIGDGFKPVTRFFHYVHCEPDSEDIKIMLEASRKATGKEPIVCGSCLSDLSVISKYGSNRAYGFGIGRDFDEEGGAHQPNEYVECDKLVDCTKTVAAYVSKVLE